MELRRTRYASSGAAAAVTAAPGICGGEIKFARIDRASRAELVGRGRGELSRGAGRAHSFAEAKRRPSKA